MGGFQFKRAVKVQFGALSTVMPFELDVPRPAPTISNLDDDGIRITFSLSRSSAGVPDKGTVQLWNLTQRTSDGIVSDFEHLTAARTGAFKAANGPPRLPDELLTATLKGINDGYALRVFAGYQKKPEQIFLGEYVEVTGRKRVSRVDHVCEIMLGDTFASLRDGYLSGPLGLGVTIPQLIQEFTKATGIRTSADAALRIVAVAPTASVTVFQNGAMGGVRAAEAMDGISDMLDHTWFVRNGELFLLPEGQAIQDFSVVLQEGVDLLDHTSAMGFDQLSGVSLMNGRIEPGRGLLILDENKKPIGNGLGYVVRDCVYKGDTHGGDMSFTTSFTATAATIPIPAIDPSELL